MNTVKRIFLFLVVALCAFGSVLAEQVNITITPKRSILPPQVMLYIANPGLYFNISVQNPDSEPISIFFGAELHQIMPGNNMDIIVPAKTYPMQGISIPANQSRMLDVVEMRNMFNHVRQTDIQIPQSLFENVTSGAFGLLDEGTYELVINAYKWDPRLTSPVLLSNPTLSRCTFTVCYQANAPKWLAPMSMNDYDDHNIATLSKQAPMLQWSSPVVSCNPMPVQYSYDLKIVQALPLQYPEEAMERNAVVYQKTGLTMSQCLIPATVIRNFAPTETYIAQITARSNNTQEGSLDYVYLQNEGKSDLLQFRVKDYSVMPELPDVAPTPKTDPETPTDSVDIFALGGKQSPTDSLYLFSNPEITNPSFAISGGARKIFLGTDIAVAWRKGAYLGGRGERPDSLKFAYAVQLFASNDYLEREQMLEREPIYTSKSLTEENDTIYWKDIKEKVSKGDYMLLRVIPAVLNENSIAFTNDSVNVVDFALVDRFAPNYFQCSNGLEITNTKPTERTAKELEGATVKIGEYDLVLDGAKLTAIEKKPGHFSGSGHVIWKPLELTWKLWVKFDDIAINTDDEVFEGSVQTFEGDGADPIVGSEVVNKLFSDWGIDNLIADTGIPYADKLQGLVDGKIASLADELGNEISGYYNDIKAGKAKVEGLLQGNVENVAFPLQIPDEINPTPVDLQIEKMIFTPTYASMNFFGTFVVPETQVTKNQILVFGAPRICISPKSLIPEGTTIALLKDFSIKDPSTDYDCTFKAPTDVISPQNGCYVSWSGKEFEAFRMDLEMTMPNLKKVANGKVTEENPKLRITADVKAPINKDGQKLAGWDWYGIAKLDEFEHEDLPGYTFSAGSNVYIDHSARENAKGMPAFPKDYDLDKAQLQGKETVEWMGVYIDELSMAFPEDIKVGDSEERMKVGLYNMFIDKSGMTVEAGIVNPINYKAGESGTIGGFAFSMDTISVNFIQNQHKDFKFCGKMEIPLLKGKVNYSCNIYNQKYSQKGTKQGYAYVFKTWQLENLNFDFWLADLSLDKNLTYFLLEALPDDKGDLHTNCELMMGGEVTLACEDKVNNLLSKLPMDLTLPGIKFCNMRVANNKSFKSTYEPEMQTKAADKIQEMTGSKSDITWWNEANDIELCGGKLFLNLGQWGYASPQKKIGPFTLALTKYDLDFSKSNGDLAFTLGGKVTLCKELDVSAETSITFLANIKNLDLDKISDLSIEYKDTQFDGLEIDASVTGFSLTGKLIPERTETDNGYTGELSFNIGNGLFIFDAKGGYYDHTDGDDRWSYGFFVAKAGAKMGIPMGPISLDSISGGVYFNCSFNSDNTSKPIAKKGAIGVVFGVALSTTGANTFAGDFDFAVCVLENKKTKTYSLSTFNFTGDVTCLDGVIKSNVRLVYENNEKEQYFQLNITADVRADGIASEMKEKIDAAMGPLQELTNKAQERLDNATGSLQGVFNDQSGKSTGRDATQAYKEATKNDKSGDDEEDGPKATAGATVSLDIRIQSRKDGQDLKNVLWHVYLGQPDFDKRCSFVLVDFKSDIVTVSVGANAYLCIGSELPDFPDIPKKVQDFLNGSSDSGVESDKLQTAKDAQKKTTLAALGELDGGVMLGAQVWGYIDVDLGLFYGEMGATAGFDVCIAHYKNGSVCVNTGHTPGYNGWYGQGQLYAYLYAKFGFRINLGFFNKKIDLVDAGIGGVLNARLPNPNYFTGKARCKLRLLDGLVNINKTFKFECGEGCDMFVGNALDDYELFETCNLGSDKIEEIEDNKISWKLDAKPTIVTQAELNKSIRVVDPTEEERMKNSSQSINTDNFTAWATRAFCFSIPQGNEPSLIEYDSLEDCKKNTNGTAKRVGYTVNGDKVVLNLTKLSANKYYQLIVTGVSKEYRSGEWKDPETWVQNGNSGKYVPTPWKQTKVYFFCTSDEVVKVTNVDDIEKVVAVAYPMADESVSEGRVIIKSEKYTNAPLCDMQRPMISLSQKCKDDITKANNGKFIWALFSDNSARFHWLGFANADEHGVANYPIELADYTQPNKWIENDSVSILTPAADFPIAGKSNPVYTIKLLYQWDEDVQDLGDWVPVEQFVVNGADKRTVTKAANDYAKKTYGVTNLRRREKPYRISVEREDYLGKEFAESNTSKFTVKILKYQQGVKTVTFTKEIYTIPVGSITNSDMNDPNKAVTKNSYFRAYYATRLDGISLDDDLQVSNTNSFGITFPQTSDIDLIGGKTKNTAYNMFSKNGKNFAYVSKDPAAYLSYLSNLFFIGGWEIRSSGIAVYVTSSESLLMRTPFDVSDHEIGYLGNQEKSYRVSDGYQSIVDKVFMTPSHYAATQSVYPLYDYGDARVGAIISPNGMQATYDGYKNQIQSLYSACSYLSNTIAYELDIAASVQKNKNYWKSYMDSHKSATYCIVSYGSEARGTYYAIKVPYYQFPIVAYTPFDQGWLDSVVRGKKKEFWRIDDNSNAHGMRRKLYVASQSGDSKTLSDHSNVVANAKFISSKARSLVNSINYTAYRVNAWNFKTMNYTVYTGSEAKTPNNFFCKRVTVSYPFDSSKTKTTTSNLTNSTSTNRGQSGGKNPIRGLNEVNNGNTDTSSKRVITGKKL